MTHDFKKGDPVILEDGKTGVLKSLVVSIAEVEINHHLKYVDVHTLRHNDWDRYVSKVDIPEIAKQRESRAGEAVAELETLVAQRDFKIFHDIMADGCDSAPQARKENRIYKTNLSWEDPILGWVTLHNEEAIKKILADNLELFDPADDGPEVEILREKT